MIFFGSYAEWMKTSRLRSLPLLDKGFANEMKWPPADLLNARVAFTCVFFKSLDKTTLVVAAEEIEKHKIWPQHEKSNYLGYQYPPHPGEPFRVQ